MTIVFFIVAMCSLGLLVITFSSVTATNCIAHVKGGSGTVSDPLLIEVEGNAGLTPVIDSLLPFRAIPAISLSYSGEKFYVPGINKDFLGKQRFATSIYLASIIFLIITCVLGILELTGRRLVIVDRQK